MLTLGLIRHHQSVPGADMEVASAHCKSGCVEYVDRSCFLVISVVYVLTSRGSDIASIDIWGKNVASSGATGSQCVIWTVYVILAM